MVDRDPPDRFDGVRFEECTEEVVTARDTFAREWSVSGLEIGSGGGNKQADGWFVANPGFHTHTTRLVGEMFVTVTSYGGTGTYERGVIANYPNNTSDRDPYPLNGNGGYPNEGRAAEVSQEVIGVEQYLGDPTVPAARAKFGGGPDVNLFNVTDATITVDARGYWTLPATGPESLEFDVISYR